MDGQQDIANAFIPMLHVTNHFLTFLGLCSHPWGRARNLGAALAIIPAAQWLTTTPGAAFKWGKK